MDYIKPQKGYSLMEMIVVLGIIGLLLSFGGYDWLYKILMPGRQFENIQFKAVAERLSPQLCNDNETGLFLPDCFKFGEKDCFKRVELVISKCMEKHFSQLNYDQRKGEECIQRDYVQMINSLPRKNGKGCSHFYGRLNRYNSQQLNNNSPQNFYDEIQKK